MCVETIKNETFSGIITDIDLIDNTSNYIFSYHFKLIDGHLRDDKCVIEKAEIGIGASIDLDQPLIDIELEKKSIKKEVNKYSKLAKKNPQECSDGLTNKEQYEMYRSLLKELNMVSDVLLVEVKDQIIDKFNSKEGCGYNDIRVENLTFVPFNRVKLSKKCTSIKIAN